MNKYGLLDEDFKSIIDVINSFSKVEKAVLFGSRAMGTYRPGSDIDIALFGHISFDDFMKIRTSLSDLDIIQKVDLLKVDDSVDIEIKNHIDRVGIVLFERNQS